MVSRTTARMAARPGLMRRCFVSSLTYRVPLGDRERAGMMVQHRYQAHNREPDEDHVLHRRHADLCARGNSDPDDRNHQHEKRYTGGDGDQRPGAAGTGGEDGEDRWPEDLDAGHRPDDVTGDHQPSGQETQIGVDRAADPLERRAAVGVPHVQPAVGVSNDEHRNSGQDDGRHARVGRRCGDWRQRKRDTDRRGGRGHADDGVLCHADRIGLEPARRWRRGDGYGSRGLMRHLCSSDADPGIANLLVAAENLRSMPGGSARWPERSAAVCQARGSRHSRPPKPSPLGTATTCRGRVGHPRDHSGYFPHITSAINVMNVTNPPHPHLIH